ncbi:MAG: ribosome recycling factor [Acholeplasma sp.]|nr:ribosome recycling factor [Acholeplasma sp.]
MLEQLEIVMFEAEENMEKAIESLRRELSGIRTGRANPALLDRITIDYYGVESPLKQIASISVVEGTQLLIKPFDKSTLKQIEHAINASDLGINPQSDAQGVRLVLPSLTGDRRKQLAKDVEKLSEDIKIVIRNVRRVTNDSVKKLELPEDVEKGSLDDVQKLTDKYIEKTEVVAKEKIKEIETI